MILLPPFKIKDLIIYILKQEIRILLFFGIIYNQGTDHLIIRLFSVIPLIINNV